MIQEVLSPIDGKKLGEVTFSDQTEVSNAVSIAKSAQVEWGKKTLKERSQVFYKYRELLAANRDQLAHSVHLENGKTMAESYAEVDKAIEVTEFACSQAQTLVDETMEVSSGIHCRMRHVPLGVVVSITPFNFPVMVPHWTIPISLIVGNAMLLKPSEKVPLSAIMFESLLKEAGLPDGVFQLVHGGKEVVDQLCENPDIKAVSFVGSTQIAKVVYQKASQALKPALCLGGAKNHLIALPDADLEMTARDVVASMTGCAGQRCMAASVLVVVGNQPQLMEEIVKQAGQVCPGQQMGAIITGESKNRIENYISEAEKQGATLLLDGRSPQVSGKEGGNYVAPTVIDNVTPDMEVLKVELFGPVLSVIHVDTVDEAIAIENACEYGNGGSVYTSSGALAQYVSDRIESGMVGINIGVPVPREPFSFGGWHASKFGTGDITGESSVHFWTKRKKVTTKWRAADKKDWMS